MASERKLRALAAELIEKLEAEEHWLHRKVVPFRIFSQIAVVLGVVAPLLAGSALLTELLADDDVARLSLGGLTLAAAVFTAIHKGLNCESYQSQARLACHRVRSLQEGYKEAQALDLPAFEAAMAVLSRRLAEHRAVGFEFPPPATGWWTRLVRWLQRARRAPSAA